MTSPSTLTLAVRTHRVDGHDSLARCQEAPITLDTDMAGRRDAFNPAALLLALCHHR